MPNAKGGKKFKKGKKQTFHQKALIYKDPKEDQEYGRVTSICGNGRFQIELDQYPGGKAVLDIYNLLGQQLYSRKINDIKLGRNYINIDLAHLNGIISSSGVLFVRIATQKQQVVKKCILLKN